jgi:hypothetical protein
MKKRIYISGAMTGHPQLNFPAFHAEAARLRGEGHEVVNPAEINLDPGADWATCLRADLAALLQCNTIRMLDGWMASRGAVLEHHVAVHLNFEVIYP